MNPKSDGAPRRTGAGRRAVCWERSSPAWSSCGGPDAQREAFHVAVRRLPAGAASAGAPDDLTLLQLPGVFAPEEWSYTFFEGLARYPAGELEGLTLAELGCGNGWISLALARRSLPRKVYALDINPRAVTCARLNLYLNGLDDDGRPAEDASGRSLLDRVEVAQSDLLAWCRSAGPGSTGWSAASPRCSARTSRPPSKRSPRWPAASSSTRCRTTPASRGTWRTSSASA